jgi:hypothetical protein
MNKEFQTDDIALAGFLSSRGHQLIELRPHSQKPGRALFVFLNDAKLGTDATDFLQDGLVAARTFTKRISRLRDRVREMRDGRHMEHTHGNHAHNR